MSEQDSLTQAKKPWLISKGQANIQGMLRPGVWLPGIRDLHSIKEVWTIQAKPGDALEKVVEAIAQIKHQSIAQIHEINRQDSFVSIYYYTPGAQWLDVVEIKFNPVESENETCTADVRSFSTGLLPVSFPLCFVINTVLFFIPFFDNHFNSQRLATLRNAMGITITLDTQCRGY